MSYMHVLRSKLYREINNFSKLLIYGAGDYANKVYTLLKSVGLQKKICLFVVTELKVQRDIDGIPIIAVDGLEDFHEDKCAVLIAVSSKFEDEIGHILQGVTDIHILKFSDYIMQDNDLIDVLRNQKDKQFIESIIEEYVWDNIRSIDEFDNKREETERRLKQRGIEEIEKNTVVFVVGNLTPRCEKIIGALVRKGFNIVLLEYGYDNKLIKNEIMSHGIDFFYCKDILEVFYRAMQYKPLVYYCEPIWGDCSGPEIMIRHRNLFGKIVFTTYDVLNDGYVQISEEQKLMERYCLENADGVVWRWFSKQFLEEKRGFAYKGTSIHFLDYCGRDKIDKNDTCDDKLKICYVQGAIYELLDKTLLPNEGIYVEPARIDTILNKIGNISDCVFHIYIGECSDSDRKKIEELEKKYFNFKAFYAIPHGELILKMSEYDYGCYLLTGGKDIPELESIDNLYFGSTHFNAVANRLFDYLDANIPIITTRPKKQCEYLEKFGVVVKMDISNIDIDYLKKNRKHYKNNVQKAKKELLIDNQIQRLIDFLNNL